ncbi:METTL7B [Symbiodinium sp. CCMP2456]|nr:METTL7B [Symbiodinium sp. CCMP2456]
MSAYLRALAALESWSLEGDQVEPEFLEAYGEAAKSLRCGTTAPRIRILDIGAGAGGDLRYIRRALDAADLSLTMVEVVAVEPNQCAWPHLEQEQKRWLSDVADFRLLPDMSTLYLEADGFDLAVLQHVLCCAQQPGDLLEEVRAALKPGGQLVFVEHVVADSAKMPYLLAAQVALRPVQRALCNGCDPCRDSERLFESQVFEEVKLKRFSLPVLGVPIPHIKGVALKSEADLTKTWRAPLTVEEFL